MIVLEVLDVAQDRFARVKALAAAGLLGQGTEPLFNLGRQT